MPLAFASLKVLAKLTPSNRSCGMPLTIRLSAAEPEG